MIIDNIKIYADTVPSKPKNFRATSYDDTSITLNWDNPDIVGTSTISDYTLEYKTGTGSYVTINDGVSSSTAYTVTGLSSSVSSYDFRLSAVNPAGTGTSTVLNVRKSNIQITSPLREVTKYPNIATKKILRPEANHYMTIPYIQTSRDVTVTASVKDGSLPVNGGVKFVLTGSSTPSSFVLYDMSAPYSATFLDLVKDDYVLNTYIVDSNGSIQSGSMNQDTATNIGVGDIYMALGDSITSGYSYSGVSTKYNDWTVATAPISPDNRMYAQSDLMQGGLHASNSYLTYLGTKLAAHTNHPVFILNLGYNSRDTTNSASIGYQTAMNKYIYKNTVQALNPNKALIMLGTNDLTAILPNYLTNMTAIINILKNDYPLITNKNIYIANPYQDALELTTYPATYDFDAQDYDWVTAVNSVVTANNVIKGPNLKPTFAAASSTLLANESGNRLHPSNAGGTEMGRLWAISMFNPNEGLSAYQDNDGINLSWKNLNSDDSSVTSYQIYYGTSTNSYSNSTTTTQNSILISGLEDNQRYYLVVRGVSPGSYGVTTYTATSSEVSLLYKSDGTDVEPSNNKFINNDKGGSLYLNDLDADLNLSIPRNFSTSSGMFGIYQYRNILRDSKISLLGSPTGKGLVGNHLYTLSATNIDNTSVHTFDNALTVTMTYTDEEIGSISEDTLVIYRNDGDEWVALDNCTKDASVNTVTCSTTNFSDFGLFGVTPIAVVSTSTASVNLWSPGSTSGDGYIPLSLRKDEKKITADIKYTKFNFIKDLKFGMKNSDVLELQKFLNTTDFKVSAKGPGSPGYETNMFGPATKKAVSKFQKSKGLPATGFFGPMTRKIVNK